MVHPGTVVSGSWVSSSPHSAVATGRHAAEDPSSAVPGPRPDVVRLLLVEDDTADAELVQDLLTSVRDRRFEVRRVMRLAEAEWQAQQDPPDLILLDLGLPDSSGLNSLERILRRAVDLPIVVLTGHDDDRMAAQAVQRGAQDYLSKDVLLEGESLLRCIRHSLERHRLLLESRRLSESARRAAAELRRIVQGNADGMVVIGPGGTVLFANQAAEGVLGRDQDELVGAPLPLPAGWERLHETEVVGGDGSHRAVELRISPLEWHGTAAKLVCLRDITERRAAEEMRQRLLHADRLRSIGQLAAGVAHEINNPAAYVMVNQESLAERLEGVRSALGRVSDLCEGWAEPGRREAEGVLGEVHLLLGEAQALIEENHHGMERVIAIVRSLRSFSPVEQGHVEMVRAADLVEDACLMVQNEIRHRAELVKEVGSIPPIAADRGRLTQVLVNLLVNAAQAIEEGQLDGNRIVVRAEEVEGWLWIDVEDTGSGMDESVKNRIFEPFFTTKGREEGTGLGLALSGEIVRQHGGEILVDSELGRGTRVRVVLPIETGLSPEATPSAPGPAADTPSRRLRVLVIDDERPLLRGLRRMLGREHDLVTACGGEEGLRTLEGDRAFDAILCDLMMPGVDGPRVLDWIERHAPELADRVVFMSGGAFTERTHRFTRRRDVRVVDKPLSSQALRSVLRALG